MTKQMRWIAAAVAALAVMAAQGEELTREQRRAEMVKLGWVEGPAHAAIGARPRSTCPCNSAS